MFRSSSPRSARTFIAFVLCYQRYVIYRSFSAVNYTVVFCLWSPVLQLVACWVNRGVELPINEPIRSTTIPFLLYYSWKFAVVRGPASGTRRTAWVECLFSAFDMNLFLVRILRWSVFMVDSSVEISHQ